MWPTKMALGKHLKRVMDEDVDGIVNTERKWHVISSGMRDIDGLQKSWYGCKAKWNRWGRSYFNINERIRRRTSSLTTGVRGKLATKIKASERVAAPEEPKVEVDPYHGCTCGATDAAAGGMIACEGEHDLQSWFHFECVGLTAETLPVQSWFCPACLNTEPRDEGDGEEYDEDEEDEDDEYEELPPLLPDHAPKSKRKRDDKDDFDDEYGPDATEATSDSITLHSTKRIKA